MGFSEMTAEYEAFSTRKVLNRKGGRDHNIRTKVGVARQFADGRLHINLNVMPFDGQVWLEPVSEPRVQRNNDDESYPDPRED